MILNSFKKNFKTTLIVALAAAVLVGFNGLILSQVLANRGISSPISGPTSPTPTATPISNPVTPTIKPTPTPISAPVTPTPTPSPISEPITGSVIKIYAAGTPADRVYPTMQLILAGRVAKTFTNISANPAIRPYTEYSYTIPVPVKITPDLVRVAFVNDLYRGFGNDRNLFVDKITIDGVTYQSERPSTFSTGSWNFSNKSCTPGNYQTEILVCNGYFEYR